MNVTGWETRKILITVKAYPNPSKKYQETTCVAGVATGQWIRLYPINFRNLPPSQAFRKYEQIEVKVKKRADDHRPESYMPDSDSIRKIGFIGTKKDPYWEERKRRLLPTVSDSMCGILRQQQKYNKSLGMFKPRKVLDFSMVQEKDEWSSAERMFQLSLVGPNVGPVEKIPYSFKYHFLCYNEGCKGHNMKIVDWETVQLYRKLRNQYKEDIPLIEKKMKMKWLEETFSPQRDSYFFVGNIMRYPKSFIILGVFWPPRKESEQLSLTGI